MELVICDNTKEIPSAPLWMWHLHKDKAESETEEAKKRYVVKFGVEPVKAYLYANEFLYFEQPK